MALVELSLGEFWVGKTFVIFVTVLPWKTHIELQTRFQINRGIESIHKLGNNCANDVGYSLIEKIIIIIINQLELFSHSLIHLEFSFSIFFNLWFSIKFYNTFL